MNNKLLISIVSHGQGELIRKLIDDMRNWIVPEGLKVSLVVTLNLYENEEFLQGCPFDLCCVRNVRPRGFGENHNTAFSLVESEFFLILNPDLRIEKLNLSEVLAGLSKDNVGVWAPKVVSGSNNLEDSARLFPTISIFIKRVLFGIRKKDYNFGVNPLCVDWVAGMFMIIKSNLYRDIKGFDERYFMYLEDADLCKRVQAQGRSVIWSPSVTVTHDARRATFKNLQHLKWHLRSAFRFIFGF
ncbi:glycosyltransferase [Chromobacterium violaceum]|uniref:glycosyltransferase n=1 Tax=Chromobacterium violaceum TaxID=536 RepID=UPI001BE96F21|nr:glycosyltransferase [Chromobacterium violaceum]MBT2869256.1 glycosyltransferase [Chromobacterium violaceum]